MSRRPNTLRIIGGRWRGRRLRFNDTQGLRPTGDRIRETAFNWLQAQLPGARCLDLFAGSGAMGLEALSRGAESVVLVERWRPAVTTIQANLTQLQATGGRVVQADALQFLQASSDRFDIVFIDPPFASDIIGNCCRLLEQRELLAPEAWIYIEQGRAEPAPSIPDHWTVQRQAQAGQVAYYLARRQLNTS